MKKNIIILLYFIGSIGLMNAQNSVNGFDKKPPEEFTLESLIYRYENIGIVTGDINTYFTREEQRLLREYYQRLNEVSFGSITAESRSANPAIIFGQSSISMNLLTFPPAEPYDISFIAQTPTTEFENAGSIDPNDENTAYVIVSGGNFYRVDLVTGVYTLLGNIPPPASETWTGAEFDPLSGELFAISTTNYSSSLSLINIGTVSSVYLGDMDVSVAISLMIDDLGDAYVHDLETDSLYYIDLANGASIGIGPLGFDANFGQGGTFIQGDPGFAYLSAYNYEMSQSEWRRVDLQTGNSTLVGILSDGADQLGWCSPKGLLVHVSENNIEGFEYFPNPTSGVLSLKSVKNVDHVSIFNLLGQQVLSSDIRATMTDIDMSDLTNGTYFMKVAVDGKTGVYKIIKL